MKFGSYVIFDVIVGYNFESGFGVKVGVDNIFNWEFLFGIWGIGFGSVSYDNIGCFGYLRLFYDF